MSYPDFSSFEGFRFGEDGDDEEACDIFDNSHVLPDGTIVIFRVCYSHRSVQALRMDPSDVPLTDHEIE